MTGDVCETCGQPLPGAARDDDCLCGDSITMHRFLGGENVSKGKRTECSRMSCGCQVYRPLEVPRDRQP